MFVTTEELKSVAYSYQLNQIVENDDTILLMAINAAIEEAWAYIATRYNAAYIFSTQGANRNALLLEIVKDIALWYIIRLSNVDILYDSIKERYDRAIQWLNRVAKGEIMPNLLALGEPTPGEDPENPSSGNSSSGSSSGNSSSGSSSSGDNSYNHPLRYGSMDKQKYDY